VFGGAQTHFGVAHYTLLAVFMPIIGSRCAYQDPKCVMGSTKMSLGIIHLFKVLKRWIGLMADKEIKK
jgi:hypothetical protein